MSRSGGWLLTTLSIAVVAAIGVALFTSDSAPAERNNNRTGSFGWAVDAAELVIMGRVIDVSDVDRFGGIDPVMMQYVASTIQISDILKGSYIGDTIEILEIGHMTAHGHAEVAAIPSGATLFEDGEEVIVFLDHRGASPNEYFGAFGKLVLDRDGQIESSFSGTPDDLTTILREIH